MRRLIVTCIVGIMGSLASATQTQSGLYFNTFGNSQKDAILFVHGGPGYNSWSFENGTAAELAKAGFYVVVYDQRGSGRSAAGTTGDFTFVNSSKDILEVIHASGADHPILLGHSWGGTPAIEFLKLQPGVARGVILAEAPLSWPGLFRTMLFNSQTVFQSRGDSTHDQQAQKDMKSMFPNGFKEPFNFTLNDTGDVFTLALFYSGIYFPTVYTTEAQALYSQLVKLPDSHWMQDDEFPPVQGFFTNESFYNKNYISDLAANGSLVYGLYSNEDGLFDSVQLGQIAAKLPYDHFVTLSGAGHFSFLDQRSQFIEAVRTFAKKILSH